MKKVLVILGPTATGKTDLALQLAKKFSGELISCDSRQVYIGLDIGTGKMPSNSHQQVRHDIKKGSGFWEINGIKIWMYDVADPKDQLTVKDYVERAEKVIADIQERNKLPIIVGGTGFYLKALLEGLPNLEIPIDKGLRGELEKLSLLKLQEKLQTLSPARWKSLNKSDRQNPRRLLRSIELVSMYPYIVKQQILNTNSQKYNLLKIGLTAPREILKKRIFDRLISRMDQGLIEEVIKLHSKGLSYQRMKELGLEYGVLADLLQNKINKDQFIQILVIKICQYAKRQLTWFKKEKDVVWLDMTDKKMSVKVEKRLVPWYHSIYD